MKLDSPLIVGTGPSAVACAAALIGAGIRPVMLDGGAAPGAGALRRREHPHDAAARRDAGVAQGSKSPGQKTWFGSSFATDQPFDGLVDYADPVLARTSYAVGGLSRVWGGTFAFFEGIDRWPADVRPEACDFDAVRRLVPSATTDFSGGPAARLADGEIPGAARCGSLMRRVAERAGDEWRIVASTVAIDRRRGSGRFCDLAGTCLDGCRSDSIWYAGDQLAAWKRARRVEHLSGLAVLAVSESADGVSVRVSDGTTTSSIDAPRVYLAAGAIGTAAIVVRSGLRRSVSLQDTATVFAAALRLGRADRNPQPHHRLSQWWARTADAAFLAQVYPPDQGNAGRLAERLPLASRTPAAAARLAGRLFPVIAYLDPARSDTLTVEAFGDTARVAVVPRPGSRREFQRQLRRFAGLLTRHGYVLPAALGDFSPAGTGYHTGASLPHGAATDALGRLDGLTRVHIVDSTVLPRLEVGSITPTVMANAVRIGRQSAGLDLR